MFKLARFRLLFASFFLTSEQLQMCRLVCELAVGEISGRVRD